VYVAAGWAPGGMREEEHPHASTNQPVNAEPRPKVTPVLAVMGLVVLIALVFIVISVLRYTT
jgi:hypothetical protein